LLGRDGLPLYAAVLGEAGDLIIDTPQKTEAPVNERKEHQNRQEKPIYPGFSAFFEMFQGENQIGEQSQHKKCDADLSYREGRKITDLSESLVQRPCDVPGDPDLHGSPREEIASDQEKP
jgi:hypothetical protein